MLRKQMYTDVQGYYSVSIIEYFAKHKNVKSSSVLLFFLLVVYSRSISAMRN